MLLLVKSAYFSARINNLFEAFHFDYIFAVIIYLTNKGLLRSLHISSRVSRSCQMSSNLNDAIFYGKGISWDMRRDINKNFIFSLALTRLSSMSFFVFLYVFVYYMHLYIYMEQEHILEFWRSSSFALMNLTTLTNLHIFRMLQISFRYIFASRISSALKVENYTKWTSLFLFFFFFAKTLSLVLL